MDVHPPEANRHLKLLCYGPAGAGKTVLAATAQDDPRTSPVLVLDLEGGSDSLVGRDIDVIRIRSWDDYRAAAEVVNRGQYRTVVIDSLSELHSYALNTILEKEAGSKPDSMKDVLDQRMYGKALTQMRRFVRSWRDAELHVIFTALSKEITDPREGLVIVPRFSGQFGEEASGMMTCVGYLAISSDSQSEGTRRVLLLNNQARFRVKTRTPYGASVPDTITEPTIGKLLDALKFEQPQSLNGKGKG